MQSIGLTLQEIQHLQTVIARLDAAAAANGDHSAERRIHPRIDFAKPMWMLVPTDPDQKWTYVYSRNLSTGGLSFLSRNLFYAGQYVVISHELGESAAMLVLCRICFCRPIDLGVQEVGLAFVTAKADPGTRRDVPSEWRARALEADWMTQSKTPTVAATS